jgi:hypothetical protein
MLLQQVEAAFARIQSLSWDRISTYIYMLLLVDSAIEPLLSLEYESDP